MLFTKSNYEVHYSAINKYYEEEIKYHKYYKRKPEEENKLNEFINNSRIKTIKKPAIIKTYIYIF